MKYQHPTIVIDRPAAGHYVIYGHNPQLARNEEGQTVVPLRQCYITPEIPSDALLAILEDRGENTAGKGSSVGYGTATDATGATDGERTGTRTQTGSRDGAAKKQAKKGGAK